MPQCAIFDQIAYSKSVSRKAFLHWSDLTANAENQFYKASYGSHGRLYLDLNMYFYNSKGRSLGSSGSTQAQWLSLIKGLGVAERGIGFQNFLGFEGSGFAG